MNVFFTLTSEQAALIRSLLELAESSPENRQRLSELRAIRGALDGMVPFRQYLAIFVKDGDASICVFGSYSETLRWLGGKERDQGVADALEVYSTLPTLELMWRGGLKAGGKPMAIRHRRRSQRMLWQVPVLLSWDYFQIPGETETVSAYGASIRILARSIPDGDIWVTQMHTRETRAAKVSHSRASQDGFSMLLGIELYEPAEDFWGLYLPAEEKP